MGTQAPEEETTGHATANAGTTTPALAEPSRQQQRARYGPTAAIPVRIKIALTIALMTALAMGSAGFLVYLLDAARIEAQLNQRIDQEIAEFRALQDGTDPTTNEPFESVGGLLRLYLERNVTGVDEMLFTYVDGQPRQSSLNQFGEALADEAVFSRAVEGLLEVGGTQVIDSPRYGEVWITLVPVSNAVDSRNSGALVIANFVDEELGELNRTIQTYAIVTLCFLGLITLLAVWRAGQLLAPLTTLRTTAETIGETDLSLRIPEQGNDDITALTRTLNDMLARLEHAFVGQRQFLDDAGHELRTPLTVLRGHLELLDPRDEQEVAETRDLLLDEIDRMSRLVGDLILLAKSDRPDFLNQSPVSVERLTHTLLSKARGLADRDWQLDEVGEGITTMDEQRITQAMLQLADNAVKHTDPGATIAIGSTLDEHTLRLWVRDSGSGIAAEARDHIFERFGRSVVRVDDDGFGLGLSIVDAIIQAHRGDVSVSDEGPPGACFVITLPRRLETSWPAS